MFGSKFLSLICICCALAGSGCATIVSPGPDYVFVTSVPNGATVTIDGRQVGQTPLNASINRRASTIAFSKIGYQTVTSGVPKEFNGWVVGNVFIGGIIGIIIDAVSENIMKVSGTISANLPKLESGDSQERPARPANNPRKQPIHDIPIFAFYSTSGIFKVYKLGEVIDQKRVNDHKDGSLRFMNLGKGNGKVLGNAGTGFVKVTQTKNSISFIESVPAGGTEHVFTVYDEWDPSVNGYKAIYHRTVNHIAANEILKTNYSGYARRAE